MESKGIAPLRLISKKFIPKVQPNNRNSKLKSVSQVWLRRTVYNDGTVLPIYRPLVCGLNRLNNETEKLKEFRNALKSGDFPKAKKIWTSIWPAIDSEHQLDADRSEIKWNDLSKKYGSYGPRVFNNALNDIARHNTRDPLFIKQLVLDPSGPIDPYILGALMTKLASTNFELALELLEKSQPKKTSLVLGCDALLCGIKMDPTLATRVFSTIELPAWYRIPDSLIGLLASNADSIDCITLLPLIFPFVAPSTRFDLLLRRIWTKSDSGTAEIRRLAIVQRFPTKFYPFLVKRLCELTRQGDLTAMKELDSLFDGPIADLAEHSPSLVLNLVVQRLIATEGVQATPSVLSRWEESDANGVSEQTWMLLFQSFRRMGRPDKCFEVLGRLLKQNPKLSLPMIGEYLHFIAKYYHLHLYLAAAQKVLPELSPIFEKLGITHYAAQLSHPRESPLYPLSPRLTADNREFHVNRIHESWLVITYQSVLATVESVDQAVLLFDKFVEYATYSDAAISLKVVDQFVLHLTQLTDSESNALEAAEKIYRTAITKLKLKKVNDGKNSDKSLESLCYKLVKSQKLDHALRLLLDASQIPNVIVRGSSFQSWIHLVPENLKVKLLEWANQIGAQIKSKTAGSSPAMHQNKYKRN